MKDHMHNFTPFVETKCTSVEHHNGWIDGPRITLVEALLMLGVDVHDAPRGAQDGSSDASYTKAAPDATAVDTPSHFEPYDAETVALVRRLRGVLHEVGMEKDVTKNHVLIQERAFRARDAADAWLVAQEKPAERWEPCEGEHVETKDGRWLRLWILHPLAISAWQECEGEHRWKDTGHNADFCADGAECSHWERKVS